MKNEQAAFPLSWPTGWKRNKTQEEARFRGATVAKATGDLLSEIERLTGRGDVRVIVSSNLALRNDGFPRSGQSEPMDPGVAVYFDLNRQPIVLACDKWDRVGDNIRAIAKDIEATRGRARWGVGTVEQAFSGYRVLVEKTQPTCFEALGIRPDSSRAEITKAFREKAMTVHPDRGGTSEQFYELSAAYSIAISGL